MSFQQAIVKIAKYIVCPYCGKSEHKISHLTVGTYWGPWVCDECGKVFCGVVREDGADIELVDREQWDLVWVLLQVDQTSPVHLILKTHHRRVMKPVQDTDEDMVGHAEYYYNEHTCPTNILRDIAMIVQGASESQPADNDPHGVFQFVKMIPRATDEEEPPESLQAELGIEP